MNPAVDRETMVSAILAPYAPNAALEALRALIAHYKMDSSVYILSQISESLPVRQPALHVVDILNVMSLMGYACQRETARSDTLDPRLFPLLWHHTQTDTLVFLQEPPPVPHMGTAYFFKKTTTKTTQEKREVLHFIQRGWFVDMLTRFRGLFAKMGYLTAILGITTLFTPLFMMLLYNQMASSWDWGDLYALGIGGLIMMAIDRTLRRLRSHYVAWFVARLDAMTHQAIFSKLIQLPAHAIESASIEAQISRLKSFESVKDFFASHLFIHILDLPFVLTAGILFGILGGSLLWIPLIAMMGYGLGIAIIRPQIANSMYHASKARSELQMSYMETFDKKDTLVFSGMQDVWVEHLRELSATHSVWGLKTGFQNHLFETACYGISVLANVALIGIGVHAVWAGTLAGGSLFACVLLNNRMLGPLQAICSNAQKIEQLYRSALQIDALMGMDTERETAASLAKAYRLRGHVVVSKIGLRYNKDSDPVLVGFSLDILPGSWIALCGETGGGKSTLLKLLLGLYKPQMGAIYIDGRDLRQIDPLEIRKKFAYVPENPYFFQGSIAENLRIANPLATPDQLQAALVFAGIETAIAGFPNGLAHIIDKNTLNFSSDLPYALSIARAYLKQSPIWLIDELPHFFLNGALGQRFIQQLQALKKHHTIVMVSNAPQVIQASDHAVLFTAGGRTQIGKPDTILDLLQRATA